MKILAIDSSGLTASAALLDNDSIIAEFNINNKKNHSQMLLPMIADIFKKNETAINEIEAIAITKGPGSFTGLRIGISTAKGLAQALNIPLIPVATVDALAFQIFDSDSIICPLMDARRGQVYSGIYRVKRGRLEILKEQCAIDIREMISFVDSYEEKVVFLGDGVPVYKELLEKEVKSEFCFAPGFSNRQRAAAVGTLALSHLEEAVGAESFKPEYLRESQAERERKEFLKTISFGPLQREEAGVAAKLDARYFKHPWNEDSICKLIDNKDNKVWAAHCGLELIAYIAYYRTADEANITDMVVDEKYRARGVGHALLSGLLAQAEADGIKAVTLEVRVSNMPARNLYESLGFKNEGLRKKYYSDPIEDACIYWLRWRDIC